MNRYKNKALNLEEMRRRREEEGIQLRKQKREEQVPLRSPPTRPRFLSLLHHSLRLSVGCTAVEGGCDILLKINSLDKQVPFPSLSCVY